jgi:hypothetical protein
MLRNEVEEEEEVEIKLKSFGSEQQMNSMRR